MDEPFSALDVATREALQDELVRLWTQTRKTILFVTHDIDEAAYLSDRIVALGGKPGEVALARHRSRYRTAPADGDPLALQEIAIEVKAAIAADTTATRRLGDLVQ